MLTIFRCFKPGQTSPPFPSERFRELNRPCWAQAARCEGQYGGKPPFQWGPVLLRALWLCCVCMWRGNLLFPLCGQPVLMVDMQWGRAMALLTPHASLLPFQQVAPHGSNSVAAPVLGSCHFGQPLSRSLSGDVGGDQEIGRVLSW